MSFTSTALAFALFAAGFAGGALNSVAGGGSFIVFPTMLLAGIPPVVANASTTVGLGIAGLGSLGAYRDELPRDRALLASFTVASLLGGLAGAKLLLYTSDASFVRILPFLMLAAALVFTFGPTLTGKYARLRLPIVAAFFVQLVIATYGGFFGGGMGIMMLATMTLIGMSNIHEMNAVKVLLGIVINGVGATLFVIAGKVVFAAAIPVAIGSIAGGWGGAALARRIDPKRVRGFVLVIAWALTAWFAYRAGALRR